MEDFFYTCTHLPDIDKKYIDEVTALIATEKERTTIFHNHVGTLCHSFKETDFFKNINKDLLCTSPVLLKWPAKSFYNWHFDGFSRNVSINIPIISPDKCLTLFKTKNKGSAFDTLIPVDYVIYKPTLLHVSKYEHCVMNYSDQDRYVINISTNHSHITFMDVVEYFKNLTFDKY